ncbi:SDR family oxidoreductase [Streptomyces sp. LHD-70]|uniref:SDR family oxidoreductase n=1 Tax=Streptomyces sp. LHD-70 TaxID=3072140 RepID=UPI00280F4B09|nr:SDR family oxidoreductase [Streptomyces sp. LHD-70]MDQ8705417.1 SDR family oxidoreductase [Streptomyces sp. LHD-70]
MTTYAVSAATGQLGTLVIDQLLAKNVEPAAIIAVARNADKAAPFAARGVTVRTADYDDREALEAAFDGVDRLLFISGSEVGKRVPQHRNVIEAAKAAGVGRVYYTSVLRATDNPMVLAPEHKATEEMLAESGVTHTILRHGWYTENYTTEVPRHIARGVLLHAGGDGRISAATRADFAEADGQALLTDYEGNVTLELGGVSFTYADLARTISEVSGTAVESKTVTPQEFRQILLQGGTDENTAGFLARLENDVAAGLLDGDSANLTDLLARPVTPLSIAVRAAL